MYIFGGEGYKAHPPLGLFPLLEARGRQDTYLYVHFGGEKGKAQMGWVFCGHVAGQSRPRAHGPTLDSGVQAAGLLVGTGHTAPQIFAEACISPAPRPDLSCLLLLHRQLWSVNHGNSNSGNANSHKQFFKGVKMQSVSKQNF